MEAENSKLMEKAGKYLTFVIKNEIYGIEILKVQEIIGMMNITQIPNVPVFVRGIINLRERVIPVVDLRVKFAVEAEDQIRNCIILIQIEQEDKNVIMGIVVDEVSEVIDIRDEELDNTPAFGGEIDTKFIMGIGKVNQKTIVLLDVDVILNNSELQMLSRVAA